MDMHQLAEVLAPSGWRVREKVLGLWREVMLAGEVRPQYIDTLHGGKVELWGGGLPWGTVMEIGSVPEYLAKREG